MKRNNIIKFTTVISLITIFISLFSRPVEYVHADDLQDKYDPRELNLVTNVKNQGSLEVCWDFAGIGALESFLLINNYGEFDFSEEHSRWICSLNEEGYGWNRKAYEGGATQIMPGYLTSWTGVKNEVDIPYNNKYSAEKPENLDTTPGVYNVTDIVYVKNDMQEIKNAILEYGAVTTTYYHSSIYLNSNNGAYSCLAKNKTANHNAIIVGWDDEYSKENFKSSNKPQNDGAWLIKNSWGVGSGDCGYLWISYEDNYILSESANKVNYSIKDVEVVDKNKKVYQYDKYGATSNLSLTVDNKKAQIMTYANVYDFSEEYNILDEIMINTKCKGAKYSLYYAYVVNGEPLLDEEDLVLIEEGIVPHAGYITFDVKDFELPKGKGGIVVKLDNTINDAPVSLGCEKNMTYVNGKDAYIADAELGESYVYTGSELIDINKTFSDSKRSFTIKAITKKSKDTGLSSVLIDDYEVVDSLAGNEINIELPYSYLGTSLDLKVIPNNSFSIINELFNGEGKILIPNNVQNTSYYFTCTSPSGDFNNYVINIFIKDSKDVSISNLPWQVDTVIEENKESFEYVQSLLKDKYLLSLYDVKLYDSYSNVEYSVSEDVEVNLPLPDISLYKNIKVVTISSTGEVNLINPVIENNKIKVTTNTFNKIGVVALNKKSNDTSLLKVIVGNDIYENVNDEINVELPYSYIDSDINISAITFSTFSIITGLASSIHIPLSGETQLINFKCIAEDGSEKEYTLNIAISKDINTSKDLEKYIENLNLENYINKILVVKYYEEIEDKENLKEEIKNKILEIKYNLQKEFCNDKEITINNLPWQVSVQAEKIQDFNKLDIDEEVLSLYNISLYDNVNNVPYIIDNEVQVAIKIDESINNKNIRAIYEKEDGTFQIIIPEIANDKVLFTINSLSKIGIIVVEDIKDELIDYDNKITKDTIEIESSKNLTLNHKEVKCGDNNSMVPYIIFGGISLFIIVFVLMKNHRKGE